MTSEGGSEKGGLRLLSANSGGPNRCGNTGPGLDCAYDLSTALDRYNRLAAIFAEASDISTEESLARALGDAQAAATGRTGEARAASRVGTAERGRAMVVLQRARPELSHDKLVAIVDAVAWWLDNRQDYKATDLLDALVEDDVSGEVNMTLLDWKHPAQPPQRPTE